ncbi:hypothetical protein HZA42_01555 [Candidatus Peregrinibacteria bacterium]|nr:hypothetical protein [Candidatus Peregrinibacteria bacterium]
MPNTSETIQPRETVLYAGSGEDVFPFGQLAIRRGEKQLGLTAMINNDAMAAGVIKRFNGQLRAVVVNASSRDLEGPALEQRHNLVRMAVTAAVPGVIVVIGEDSQQLPANIRNNPAVFRFSAGDSIRRIEGLLPERYRTLSVKNIISPADAGIRPGQELVWASDPAQALEIIEKIHGELMRILLELGMEDTPAGQDIIGAAQRLKIPTIGLATRTTTGNGELMIATYTPSELLGQSKLQ